MEANEGAQNRNEDGNEDVAGAGTETRVEIRGRTQERNGDGSGTETRSVVEMGTGTRMGTETGIRIGLGRTEDRRRSARSRTRVVYAMWEKGETLVEREKHVEKKGLVR